MKNEILGIVTAKGRSTGLPNKNLHPFCGRPLLSWTIEASLRSRYVNRTVVSSETEKILKLSEGLGANVIERPLELATDTASSIAVMMHAVDYLKRTEDYKPDVLVLLQPTSPLRTCEDIDNSIELYLGSKCSAVISGYEPRKNPLKDLLINDDGRLAAIMDEKFPFSPRQQLPRAFRPNGAIYIVDAGLFVKSQSLLTDDTKPFFMDEPRSIDIDNIEDLQAAEDYLKNNELKYEDTPVVEYS